MADYIKLTKQEILDKDFEVEYKGYKVEEVDAFLDTIAEDYKVFFNLQEKATKKVKELQDEVEKLSQELTQTLAVLKLTEEQKENLAKQGLKHSSIVERLARLEKNNQDR